MGIGTAQLPLAVLLIVHRLLPICPALSYCSTRAQAPKPHCEQHMALFNPEQSPGLGFRLAQQS